MRRVLDSHKIEVPNIAHPQTKDSGRFFFEGKIVSCWAFILDMWQASSVSQHYLPGNLPTHYPWYMYRQSQKTLVRWGLAFQVSRVCTWQSHRMPRRPQQYLQFCISICSSSAGVVLLLSETFIPTHPPDACVTRQLVKRKPMGLGIVISEM